MVTTDEIEEVILKGNIDKALSVDGFNMGFYKACLGIIKEDVINAIIDVFQSGKVLRQVNITSISLVPKVPNPISFAHF